MEKLHKRNLIIVWCSVVALSLVSLMGYGFTVLAIRGIAILVVAGIISTIGCYLSIDDVKKVLIPAGDRYAVVFVGIWWQFDSVSGEFCTFSDDNFLFYGVGYHLFRSAVYGYFGRIYDLQS